MATIKTATKNATATMTDNATLKIVANPELADRIVATIQAHEQQHGKPMHVVFSGLNEALRRGGYDPIAVLARLAESGRIYVRPCKGGALASTQPMHSGPSRSARELASKLGL